MKEETFIPEFNPGTFTDEELVDKIVEALFPQYDNTTLLDLSNLTAFENYDLNIKCRSNLKDLKVYSGFKRTYYTVMDFLINDEEIAMIRFPLNITEINPDTDIYPEGLKEDINKEIINCSNGKKKFYKKNLIPIIYNYVSAQKEFKGNFKFLTDHTNNAFSTERRGIKYFVVEKLEMVE